MTNNILEFFPYETPRDTQKKVLLEVERQWDKSSVFSLICPTAAGKTSLAHTIMNYAKSKGLTATYLHPTNNLVDQYAKEFPDTPILHRKSKYMCKKHEGMNVAQVKKLNERTGKTTKKRGKRKKVTKKWTCKCPDCPYDDAVEEAHCADTLACNYHIYMAHQLECDVLIVDEAHRLIPFIRDFASTKIWKSDWNYPSSVTDHKTLKDFLKKKIEYVNKHKTDEFGDTLTISKAVKAVLTSLEEGTGKYLIKKDFEERRGHEEEVIKCMPLEVSEYADLLLKVKGPSGKPMKVVLLSATVSRKDVKELGYDKKAGIFVEAESPIPVAYRPIVVRPLANMGFKNWDWSIPKLVDYIKHMLEIPETQGKNGFIHAPYSLARRIKAELADHPRLLFHDQLTRESVLQEFLAKPSDSGTVMVASGLEEGVDLKNDLARWQIITKMPYPSLADPAIKKRCETDPEAYAWDTIKMLLQACGRISRHPTDEGVTFIVDSCFNFLYNRHSDLMPNWFKNAIIS